MAADESVLTEIHRFLAKTCPFSFFSQEELTGLVAKIDIKIFGVGAYIFKKEEEPGQVFYLVKQGAVDVLDDRQGDYLLVDRCGEGDMFGLRPLIAKSPYLFYALSKEETTVYEIPIASFQEMYLRHEEATEYMIQRFVISRNLRDQIDTDLPLRSADLIPSLVIKPRLKNRLISTGIGVKIQEAITIMSQNGVSYILIVNDKKQPVGIITDRDVRDFVAQGYDANVSIHQIMSSPVRCIPPSMNLLEIQMVMITMGFNHLCVTEDGTDQSAAIDMITEHDMLYASTTDPVIIIKKINTANTIEELVECRQKIDQFIPSYLEENGNKRLILSIVDRLNRILIQRTVSIVLDEFNGRQKQPIEKDSFCFYTMGSVARGEQLLMTDQDNGIIYQDEFKNRQLQYLELGDRITYALNGIGFDYCPANMMASNQAWCLSEQEMKQNIADWMLRPGPEESLKISIFFDFRFEFGNAMLAKRTKDHISELLEKQEVFLRFFARHTISNRPPLSFFRRFIVEKNGEHKEMFDIKKRAIAPITDSARILALEKKYLQSSNSLDRIDAVKKTASSDALLYEEAQEALLFLLGERLRFALQQGDSGRYISPKQLSQVEKMHLRKHFVPAQKIIDMLERRYRPGFI